MNFKQLFESDKIFYSEFIEQVENTYHNYFPRSRVAIMYRQEDTTIKSIWIDPKLANDKKEVAYGIWDNDLFDISFFVTVIDGNLNDLEIAVRENVYYINGDGKSLEQRKVSFRKSKGDFKKILGVLDKYFKNLKESLQQDLKDNLIPEKYIELLKKKL